MQIGVKMINKERIKRLRKAFKYLELYDELGDYPNKKVPVSISLPLAMKHKLKTSKIANISKYVENLINRDLTRRH